MKAIAVCCAALFGLQLHSAAYAVPRGMYHPASGAIFLSNDTGGDLAHISVLSAGGNLRTDPALYASFPGAIFDSGDLPGAFTYLSFPEVGLFSPGSYVGNVVVPGTPLSDLSGYYRSSFLDPPQPLGFVWSEPTSSAIGAVGALAFVSLSRRFRKPVSERVE